MNFRNTTTCFIDCSAGKIAICDSKPKSQGDEPTIIFIHGHLTNKSFFAKQLQASILAKYRLISLDLPGYGESPPPHHPEKTYSFTGFAEVVSEIVNFFKLKNFVIVGWSLGGHIALELTTLLEHLRGILITGSPPIEISAKGLSRGFRVVDPKILECFGKGCLSQDEAELMATISGYDGSKEKKFIVDAILQTDEDAKTLYPQSILKGIGQNELEIVQKWHYPIAVIAGENDAGINTDYILEEVTFFNLWREKIHIVSGAGHAVHMDKPNEFNEILSEFANEIFKS